jgi:hypothetical protein
MDDHSWNNCHPARSTHPRVGVGAYHDIQLYPLVLWDWRNGRALNDNQKDFIMAKNGKKFAAGYWISVGVSIGIAIGAALGPIFDNFGAGIGVGIAIGAGIGTAMEQRNKDNLRPLTELERIRQKRSIAIGLALAAILAVVLVIAYFLQAG